MWPIRTEPAPRPLPAAGRLLVALFAAMLLALPAGASAQSSTPDYRAAFEEALPRAQAGDHRAQVQVARYYLSGQGVAADPAEAVRWFRAAAEGGRVEGMKWLADLYFSGTGVERDDAAGLSWLQQAALAGDTDARFLLGKLYWQGQRTPRDPVAAWAWLRLAADKTPQPGSREAARLLPRVAAAMTAEESAEAQARHVAGDGGGIGATH